MVASRCASGIGTAITRSLILTLSAVKAGADSESVNAAKAIMRAHFSSSDIGKPPSSARRPGETRCARRTPIDNRRAGAVGQHVAGDLVLPGEPDVLLSLRVGEEAVKGSNPAGMAGDAIVQADHHHAPSMHALFVKLIELVAQRLLVGGRIPADEGKADDVVHVEGVRDGDEIH